MAEREFVAHKNPDDPSRDELRALLNRYKPKYPSSGIEPASENSEAWAGATLGF